MGNACYIFCYTSLLAFFLCASWSPSTVTCGRVLVNSLTCFAVRCGLTNTSVFFVFVVGTHVQPSPDGFSKKKKKRKRCPTLRILLLFDNDCCSFYFAQFCCAFLFSCCCAVRTFSVLSSFPGAVSAQFFQKRVKKGSDSDEPKRAHIGRYIKQVECGRLSHRHTTYFMPLDGLLCIPFGRLRATLIVLL